MKKLFLGLLSVVVVLVLFVFAYMGWFFKQSGVVSKGEPIVAGGTDIPALMVIDIQEGITGTLASSFTKGMQEQSGTFIRTVNASIEKAQALGMPVVYIRQENKDRIVNLITGGKMLRAGTASTEIDARVKIVPGPEFMKLVGDAFSNPELDAYLREKQVNHLYMTGLSATQCVHRTIQGALQRGYKVTAISDAIIAETVEHKEKALVEYKQEGVEVETFEEWQ